MLCAFLASILVTFPAENQRLPATACTYVIGAADTNRQERLYLNGVGIDVYRTGAFLAMAGTKPGTPPGEVHVMVDAGHGGRDTGALSPRGLKEKDFNMMLAKSVESVLRKAGFKVSMTRTDDATLPLYDRPRRAYREKVDAFISIHHNATGVASDPRDARHTVTYASNENGLALAKAVQRHVAEAVAPVRNKGAEIKSLAVCRNPAVPSCLVEADFINLPEGEEASLDPARRERIANAILLGLLDWLYE